MLKTNVDKLLEILKERKEVMISDLASHLNTTPSNIEKIAKMLEEEKLVTIRYKMMKPYLVYGFKEKKKKVKGKKKPLIIWKKKKKQTKEIPRPTKNIPLPKKKTFFSKLFKLKVKPKILPKPLPKSAPKPFQKPLPKPKKSFFSKLFKKKTKKTKETVFKKPVLKPHKKNILPQPFSTKQTPKPKPKKSLFSKLFKTKPKTNFKELKKEIKNKGIRLEKNKQTKPIIPKFSKPIKFKKKEKEKQVKIESEEDAKNEIDRLINMCNKVKDKNLIKRNYKKALALYSRLKKTDNQVNYNKKIKNLYNKLTK